MFDFRAEGGAGFSYSVDFSDAPYANISFFDESRLSIPFHLSLRHETGLAVFNQRKGSQWGAEQGVSVTFEPGLNRVELQFAPPRTTVLLNGKVIFRLDGKTCPATETIICAAYQGAIRPATIVLGGARYLGRRNRGEIAFTGAFEVTGWGFEPGANSLIHALEVAGLDEPLRPGVTHRPDLAQREGSPLTRIGIEATLPGRVWLAEKPDAALTITLTCNGTPCGASLSLTRPDALAQIETITAKSDATADTFAALLLLEHVRYGGFWPDLSPQARDWTLRAAEHHRLMPFLFPPEVAGTALPVAAPEMPPLDEMLLEAMRTSFAQAWRAAPPGTDLLTLLPDLPPRGSDARRLAWLVLTEHFCAEGAFPALHARVAAEGLAEYQPGGGAWHDSAILPFLYCQNRFDTLRDTLTRLVPPQAGWMMTAPLAWVMQSLACDPPPQLSEKMRQDLVQPFLDFVTRRAALYWERSACRHLTHAMTALLAAQSLFSDDFTRKLTATAIRAYGLSQGFWDVLPADGLSGDLVAARAAWTLIEGHVAGKSPASPAALTQALRLFDRFGNPDTARFRVELLGPGNGTLAALYEASDPARAALRHLAFPSSQPANMGEAPALADLARRAGIEGQTDVPRAPYHALQGRVSRAIAALLAASEPKPVGVPAPLLADLRTLSRGSSRYLGLALALVLMNGLLRMGARTAAQGLLAEIAAMRAALTPSEVDELRASPAMASALYALRQTETITPDPLLTPLLRHFPGVLSALPARRLAPRDPEFAAASPLFDTLVMIISCRANLATRIPALESAWAHRLTALGIPYLVVVGGGEGEARREGRVLYLPAPDNYEGLPQKVLAAVDWVCRETPFAHMLKIDDDCFLDAEAFFHSQSWRKSAYYGRKLTRVPGELDRTWHFAKSASARGRLELDKSPEPSSYADGGSGYMLARPAMEALLARAATAQGQRLVQTSFMEDKTVGDLLAMAGITAGHEDYVASVQRRTHAAGIPVSLWANGFWPSRASGVKTVHLDSAASQPLVAAQVDGNRLHPHKIWPSYAEPMLGANSNLLELVSPVEKLESLNAAPLAVVACTRNERFLLPHFLAHYRKLGVACFLIADNASDDGTLEYLAGQADVVTFSVDSEYRISQYGVAWQQAILSNLRMGRWSLVADIDELVVTGTDPATAPSLAAITLEAEAEGADALRLFMLDLYPQGPLSAADFATGTPFDQAGFCDAEPFLTNCPSRGPYGDAPTWTSALRHRLIPGARAELFVAQKAALLNYRPWMRLSAGLHYVAGAKLARRQLVFAHFKYHAEFRRKALAEVSRRQHFNNAEEYRRYLALISEGRDVIHDPALSVRWQDSAAVQRLLSLP